MGDGLGLLASLLNDVDDGLLGGDVKRGKGTVVGLVRWDLRRFEPSSIDKAKEIITRNDRFIEVFDFDPRNHSTDLRVLRKTGDGGSQRERDCYGNKSLRSHGE